MAKNKIVYSGEVLLDLTGDTVAQGDVRSGVTFHDKSGVQKSGSLVIQAFHVVQSQPSSVINGDLYFLV